MTTADTTSSGSGRLRTLALAGILVIGTMLPMTVAVRADADDPAVAEPTAEPFDITGEGVSGRTAVVAAGGEGADLLAEPTTDAEVVQALPDGTTVDLRIDEVDTVYDPDGVTRWWPVAVGGSTGWVSGFFLADAGGENGDGTAGAPVEVAETPASSDSQFVFDGEANESATAQVAGDGERVNVRAEPSAGSELVTTAADGQIVTLRIASLDTVLDADGVTRWWPVTVDGIDGWISGAFLTNTTEAAPATEAAAPQTPATSPATTSLFPAGSSAVVGSGDGYSVTLRAEGSPAAEVVGNLSDGQTVQVLDGPVSFESSETGWFQVTVADLTGYVDGDLLSPVTEAPETGAPASGDFAPGDQVVVRSRSGAGINVRAGASRSSERIGTFADGVVLDVTEGLVVDETGESWYGVSDGELSGWVVANLVVAPDATPAEPEPAETPVPTAEPTTESTAEATTEPQPTATETATVTAEVTEDAPEVTTPGEDADGEEEDTPIPATTTPPPSTPETDPEGEEAAESTGFIYPLETYTRTQGFGCSSLGFYPYNPDFGCAVHDGLDLAAPSGTPLRAAAAGEVVAAGWCDCGLGYYVEIDHGSGVHTVYGHMNGQPSVSTGQQVGQGDAIGQVGSTGISTGPHVHFMVRVNGVAQNPENYLL